MTSDEISDLTHLHLCDEDCGCGESTGHWYFPVTASARRRMPDWVPGWMNGVSTEEIVNWLDENKEKWQEDSKHNTTSVQ